MSEMIRHIAVSADSTHIAFGAFEQDVVVCQSEPWKERGRWKSILTFGGNNLALSANGSYCAVASNTKGVALYETTSGQCVWHRKELKEVRGISFRMAEKETLFLFTDTATDSLSITNGATIETFPKVMHMHWSLDGIHSLQEEESLCVLKQQNKKELAIPRLSFAILAVAFTPKLVIISEARGPISAYALTDGALVWQKTVAEGQHVTHLAYHQKHNSLVGILHPYQTHDADELIHLAITDGSLNTITSIERPATALFTPTGEFLLTSEDMIETRNGHRTKSLKAIL